MFLKVFHCVIWSKKHSCVKEIGHCTIIGVGRGETNSYYGSSSYQTLFGAISTEILFQNNSFISYLFTLTASSYIGTIVVSCCFGGPQQHLQLS